MDFKFTHCLRSWSADLLEHSLVNAVTHIFVVWVIKPKEEVWTKVWERMTWQRWERQLRILIVDVELDKGRRL